jgi:hypothetical protein
MISFSQIRDRFQTWICDFWGGVFFQGSFIADLLYGLVLGGVLLPYVDCFALLIKLAIDRIDVLSA